METTEQLTEEIASGASMAQPSPITGRVALVTGAGRGLGAAVCRALASAGATVLACDIQGDLARDVARGIRAVGGESQALALDITDRAGAARLVEGSLERYGSLDVLVNNAGVDVTQPFDELAAADFDRILDVNLRAPIDLCRLVLGAMRERGRGHIINVTSTAAKRAWPNASAYHTSKWGLLGFSHALHSEARGYGVKVTAVVSGGMRTPFLFDRFPDLDPATLQEPERVAEAVLFALNQPEGSVIPEMTVLPMGETSWP